MPPLLPVHMLSAPWESSRIFASKLDCVPSDMPPFRRCFGRVSPKPSIAKQVPGKFGPEKRVKWYLEDTINEICAQQQSPYPLNASQDGRTDGRTDRGSAHGFAAPCGAKQAALGAMKKGGKSWSKRLAGQGGRGDTRQTCSFLAGGTGVTRPQAQGHR